MAKGSPTFTNITAPQAAEMLGVTPQCVRKMVTDGHLTGSQYVERGDWKIELVSVQELHAQRQHTAASKLEQQARSMRRSKGGTRTILAGTPEDTPVPADLSRLAGAGRLVRIEQRLTEIEAVLAELAKAWEL